MALPMFKKVFVSQVTRRRVSWTIAAVLILPFLFFFHATGQAPATGPGGTAGVLFGKQIPWDTFQEQRLWLQRQLESRLGEAASAEIEAELTQFTWDRLLLLEEARRRHLKVDDLELGQLIQSIPAFQEQGRFVADRYHRFLLASGTTAPAFERLLRNDVLVDKLVTWIRNAVPVTEEDARAVYLRTHETLTASVLRFDAVAFTSQASAAVTEDEIRSRYEARPDDARVPERITLEWLGAGREELASKTQVSDQDVQDFYDNHRDRFGNADGSATPLEQARAAARQQLIQERVRKQLTALALDLDDDRQAKRGFEDIATSRALSRQTVGPAAVGDLWAKGAEPAVLQAAAGLAEGAVSGVVETDNGVYLVRVTQRTPARLPPLEDVRDTIRQALVQERAKGLAKDAAEAAHTRLEEDGAKGFRFEESVRLQELAPETVQLTRLQPLEAFGFNPALNRLAFEAPPGQPTAVLETPLGCVIVRPEARQVDESAFESVKAGLRETALRQKQSESLERFVQELRVRGKLQSFVDLPQPSLPASPQ